MRKPTKLIMFIVAPLTLLFAYLGTSLYIQKTFRLRISIPVITEKASPIASEINKLAKGARDGAVPWRAVDHSSVGHPQQEAKLLELRSGIDFFSGTFGRLPTDINEMSRLPVRPANKYEDLIKDCQILTLGPESYIVNCDRWSSPPPSQMGALVRTFGAETERFYVRQDHVILYVPHPVSGPLGPHT